MRKFLSILLAIAMLAGTVCVSAQDGESVSTAVEFLGTLGILPEDFAAEEEMTRAEFVDLTVRALRQSTEVSGDTAYFLDVDKSHPYYGSISIAMQLGIIEGNGDYTFMPDKKITFEQAVRIAAAATGYTEIAERKGGFYGGYMTIAADKDMLDGLNRDTTGENLAALVFNMLSTPMLDFKGFSADSVEYSATDDDNTLLNRHWDILKREGFVTETGYSTYTGAGALGKGRVKLDEEIFLAGETDAESYFGREVVYFYYDAEDSGTNELVYVYAEDDVDEMTIAAEDIADIDLFEGKLTYLVNERQKTVRFSKTPYVIYNGVGLADYQKADLMPEYGSIRLMDGDDDGTYEFLFVSDVQYFVVGAVNITDKKLYEKYTHDTIEFEDEDIFVSITKDGKELALDSIKEMYVLNVCESRDGKMFTIEVSDKTVEGVISSVSEDGAVIDGIEYDIYTGINKPLSVGLKNTMYISVDNVIVAAELVSSDKYAYLCRADLVEEENEEYKIKVVTQDGTTKYFTLAEKVKYDDTKKDADEAHRDLNILCQGGLTRVIGYETNTDGEIKTIKTATENLKGQYGYDEQEFTLDFNAGGSEYRYYKRMFGGNNMLTSDCLVWVAPYPDENYVVDSEKVQVSVAGYFEDGDRYKNFKLFNYNEFMAATMCEYVGNIADELSNTVSAFVVDKARTEVLSSGDLGIVAYGYRDGKYTTLIFDEESKLKTTTSSSTITKVTDPSKFRRGDVIQASVDGGVVDVYRILYNTADGLNDARYYATGGGYNEYPALETLMGRMENISDESMVVSVNGTKSLFFTNNADVYIIKDGEIKTGSIYGILTGANSGVGARVFLRVDRKKVQEIVVYE